MSLEALEYALEHHGGVRAVVAMPSFQNPLGACMSEAAKRRLLKIVQRHGIALIEDDVFGDLGSAAERPPAVKAWDRDGRVIYCGSCSKSMAPGFRLGWVLGGRHQRQLESLKIGSSLAAPLLEQQVLADYMKSGRLPAHLRRLRTQLAQAAASARAQRHFPQGTRVLGPEGGWWLWLELPEPADTLALLRDAVSQGIAYTPGALFSAAGKHGHCLRLNVARPWSTEMAAGLERLGLAARLAATRNQAPRASRLEAMPDTHGHGGVRHVTPEREIVRVGDIGVQVGALGEIIGIGGAVHLRVRVVARQGAAVGRAICHDTISLLLPSGTVALTVYESARKPWASLNVSALR